MESASASSNRSFSINQLLGASNTSTPNSAVLSAFQIGVSESSEVKVEPGMLCEVVSSNCNGRLFL